VSQCKTPWRPALDSRAVPTHLPTGSVERVILPLTCRLRYSLIMNNLRDVGNLALVLFFFLFVAAFFLLILLNDLKVRQYPHEGSHHAMTTHRNLSPLSAARRHGGTVLTPAA
jgi:hypothetical protein